MGVRDRGQRTRPTAAGDRFPPAGHAGSERPADRPDAGGQDHAGGQDRAGESGPPRTRRSTPADDPSATGVSSASRRGADGPATEADASGHLASSPGDMGSTAYKAVAQRVVRAIKRDHVNLLAAGVAFKALLALFPAIIAAISIWGLVASPEQITEQLSGLLDAAPDEAADLIEAQMTSIAGSGAGALSTALVLSILISLWSASGGTAGLVEGCNAAYDEVDERSFPRKRGLALVLTLGAIVFLAVSVGLIAVLPALLGEIGLGAEAELAIRIGQWPLLGLLTAVVLALIYRYGPDRRRPQARWVSWGAVIATVLWLVGSGLFALYVERFGDFGETYGALAGVIVLMLWLYLSAFVVLLGAEINAELERQTARDTTVGHPRPLGSRGSVTADSTPADLARDQR